MIIASEDFIITLENGERVYTTLEMYESGAFDYGNGHGVALIEECDNGPSEQTWDARYDSRFDTEETFKEHALHFVKEHVRPTCTVERVVSLWVPVEKSVPKKSALYWVTLENGTVDFCFYYPDKEKWGWGNRYHDDVIAWQPLPKPYKKKEK